MNFHKLSHLASAGQSVAQALTAIGSASEAVPESSPVYTGGAASAIGMNPAGGPVPFPTPFYTPPVQVSDAEIKKEAEVRASLLLARLRFGSSVLRNFIAEIIVKSSDEETLSTWERQSTELSTPPAGTPVAKAFKRIAVKNKLKDFKSPISSDDSELVGLLKEALFLDLKQQAQRGEFKKMGYDEMLMKLVSIELYGLVESVTEPITEMAKESLFKSNL